MYIYDQVFSNGQLIFLNKLTVGQAFAKMVGNCLMSGHNFRLCSFVTDWCSHAVWINACSLMALNVCIHILGMMCGCHLPTEHVPNLPLPVPKQLIVMEPLILWDVPLCRFLINFSRDVHYSINFLYINFDVTCITSFPSPVTAEKVRSIVTNNHRNILITRTPYNHMFKLLVYNWQLLVWLLLQNISA